MGIFCMKMLKESGFVAGSFQCLKDLCILVELSLKTCML